MTLTIALAVASLLLPVAIWFVVIKPRLGARWSETYADVAGFHERQWARVVAFKTWVIFNIGYYATEIPGALTAFGALDHSWLPDPFAWFLRTATIVAMVLSRAYSTTPAGTPVATSATTPES